MWSAPYGRVQCVVCHRVGTIGAPFTRQSKKQQGMFYWTLSMNLDL